MKRESVPALDTYSSLLMDPQAVIPIFMEKDIFGQTFSDEINKENIRELVEHQWLSATVITVYARYLYYPIIMVDI